MFTLQTPPLFSVLDKAERVLIAGAGGGFDVYAGLPLAIALTDMGKQVHLGSLTFSSLDQLELEDWVAPGLASITAYACGSEHYFPERTLARWLAGQCLPPQVYAFERSGVLPLRDSYQWLVDRLGIDAVVLVDGGTDILMRGDEAGLGTPEEDMARSVLRQDADSAEASAWLSAVRARIGDVGVTVRGGVSVLGSVHETIAVARRRPAASAGTP